MLWRWPDVAQPPMLDATSRRIRTIGEVRLLRRAAVRSGSSSRSSVWFAIERAGFDLRHAFLPAARRRAPRTTRRTRPPTTRRCSDDTPTSTRRSSRTRTAPLTLLSTTAAVEIGMVASFRRGARRSLARRGAGLALLHRRTRVAAGDQLCRQRRRVAVRSRCSSLRRGDFAATRAGARERSSGAPSPRRRSPGRCSLWPVVHAALARRR